MIETTCHKALLQAASSSSLFIGSSSTLHVRFALGVQKFDAESTSIGGQSKYKDIYIYSYIYVYIYPE